MPNGCKAPVMQFTLDFAFFLARWAIVAGCERPCNRSFSLFYFIFLAIFSCFLLACRVAGAGVWERAIALSLNFFRQNRGSGRSCGVLSTPANWPSVQLLWTLSCFYLLSSILLLSPIVRIFSFHTLHSSKDTFRLPATDFTHYTSQIKKKLHNSDCSKSNYLLFAQTLQ